MSQANSSGIAKSGGTEQDSAQSKGTVPRRRNNMQMVQNVLLIWLNSNIDESSTDCRNTITQLRRTVNTINTFMDGEECIQFLDNMNNDKACMIISGSLGQHIVPRIHNMSQVDSIFIFCSNKKRHEQWAKEWPKIKGVFTQISPICDALKQAAKECEQNTIPMSFVGTNDDVSKQNLDQLNPSFMYTQILKEILLTIQFEQKHFKEFINYCCDAFADNESGLKNVKKFEQTYRHETPIWWYTYECFLYPMLNRALRLMDANLIIQMGFFVSDLHRHIKQLHNEQFGDDNSGNSFKVYRGQGMVKDDFEKMTKTRGGLISFNNFLSTSKNHDVSRLYAESNQSNPDLMGILFIMTINPSKSTTPFASITDVSYYKDKEDEVLFSMHTVFRICNITPVGENHRLFQVELTLTSDNDKELRRLTDRIREETCPNEEGWFRLGEVLLKMGESDKAQQVYGILLDQATEESEKASIYHQFGRVKYHQGQYKQGGVFFEKSIEIKKKILPSNHHTLANSIACLGLMYQQMGEHQKALSFYEEALQIHQQILSPNDPHLALSYNNIGAVYFNMGKYSEALSSYEKALEIRKQSLPTNHPDLGSSYFNIGLVYFNMGEYSKALSYSQKDLEISQKSLPPNHPDLGCSYNHMGWLYENIGNYSKARTFYEHAVEIGQRSLPSIHPRFQKWRNNLEDVKKKL